MSQILFRLKTEITQSETKGEIRPATSQDMELIKKWIKNFYKEALKTQPPNLDRPPHETEEYVQLYLWWHENQPTAMGMINKNRLNLIYTPPPLRNKGYGRAITAALARLVQEKGQTPVLHTKSNNTAAIGLYTSLGFTVQNR